MADTTTAAPAATSPGNTALTSAPAAGAGDSAAPAAPGAASIVAEASKPAAPAGTEAPVELKWPEGFAPDTKFVGEKFMPLLKEAGIKGEHAQKLADLYVGLKQTEAQQSAAKVEQAEKSWAEALNKDPDFGGQKFEATRMQAHKAMKAYADADTAALLDTPIAGFGRLGNHPALIKLMARAGRAMAESTVAGTVNSPPKSPNATFGDLMYPSMQPSKA